jgi:hypothetical protein
LVLARSDTVDRISAAAFRAAAQLIDDYFLPNADRVYGQAGHSDEDRNVTRLARWIVKTKADSVHVRTLQRDVRLQGLGKAEAIHSAATALISAGWLRIPDEGIEFGKRGSMIYAVNPAVHDE